MNRTTTIKEADNGFIVTHISEFKDDKGIWSEDETVWLCEGVGDNDNIANLLTYLGEWYGEPYSKHSKTNIRISWDRPGSKVESEPTCCGGEGCDSCKSI